jgi:hypothetical protein
MENIKAVINETLKDIEQITENFYQQKQSEGYLGLVKIIDSLVRITDYLSSIEKTAVIAENNILIMNALQDATEALANKDSVLLADILKYDISDVLKHLLDTEL